MAIRISVDLDNTVFNMAEKYRAVIESFHEKYVPPVSYDVYKNGYSVAVADALHELLNSDQIYKTRVFDNRIPKVLNSIYNNPKYDLFYVTERLIKNHLDTLGQLEHSGIICEDNHLVHRIPKLDALKEYEIQLCFDDAPHVVSDCLENNIDVVMISNPDTAYNHHLCEHVEHYPDLMTALIKRGIIME
jgi:hypothetical protein